MPFTFLTNLGTMTKDNNGDECTYERKCADEANFHGRHIGPGFKHLRNPHVDTVYTFTDRQEVSNTEDQNSRVSKSFHNRVVGISTFNGCCFFSHTVCEPIAFFFRKPCSISRFICQIVESYKAEEYSRDPFDEEQPAPAGPAHDAIERTDKEPGNERTDDESNRLSQIETGERRCTIFVREPFADEIRNARIEAGFRCTE